MIRQASIRVFYLSKSVFVRETFLLLGAYYLHPLLFLIPALIYGALNRRRLTNEISILFLKVRLSKPKLSRYNTYQKDGVTFFMQKKSWPYWLPNFFKKRYYFDPILQVNGATLYLGALPEEKHLTWIQNQKCRVVLSILEDWEYYVPGIAKILLPRDWAKKGIRFYQFSTPDFSPLSDKDLIKATKIAITALKNGQSVIIHCRGGKGRSPSLVVEIMAQLTGKTFQELIEMLQKARPQILLTAKQKKQLVSINTQKFTKS